MDNDNFKMPDFSKPPPNIGAQIFNFPAEQSPGVPTFNPSRISYMPAPQPQPMQMPMFPGGFANSPAASFQSLYGPMQPHYPPQYHPQQFQPQIPIMQGLYQPVAGPYPGFPAATAYPALTYNLNSSERQLPSQSLRAMSPHWHKDKESEESNVLPTYHPVEKKSNIEEPKFKRKAIVEERVEEATSNKVAPNTSEESSYYSEESSDDLSSQQSSQQSQQSSCILQDDLRGGDKKVLLREPRKVMVEAGASEKIEDSDGPNKSNDESSDPFEGLNEEAQREEKKILSNLTDIFAGKKLPTRKRNSKLSLKRKESTQQKEDKKTAVQSSSQKARKPKRMRKTKGKGKRKTDQSEDSEEEEDPDDPPQQLTFSDDSNVEVHYVSSDTSDDSLPSLDRTSQTGGKKPLKESESKEKLNSAADLCSVGLEELIPMQEVLQCKPCGCANACVPHGAEWVANHQTCYQCRTGIISVTAVLKLGLK